MRCERGTWSRRSAIVLLGAALALGGCMPPRVDYSPRLVISDEAGITRATQRLEETVARARSPRVVEVSADAWELYYRTQRGHARYVHFCEVAVPFQRVARVELFEGALVRLSSARGLPLASLRFYTQADAAEFADLVHSLSCWRPYAGAPPRSDRFGLDGSWPLSRTSAR